VEAAAGARILDWTSAALEARAGIGVSVWPSAWAGRAGLGVEARLGPGIDVATPSFFGRFTETALRAAVHARLFAWRRLAATASTGGALHLASLDGELAAAGTRARVSRLDPAFFVGMLVEVLATERVSVGPYVEVTYLLRTQQYVAADQIVFEPSPFQLDLGAKLALALN
jgi:hypothetical protein